MATGEPGSGRDLPAPYRSPWGALGESLRAVSADLGLSLRRLWRRNRDGDLPRPGFWPQAAAALFWPLLLGLPLLALLIALALRPAAQPAADTTAPPPPVSTTVTLRSSPGSAAPPTVPAPPAFPPAAPGSPRGPATGSTEAPSGAEASGGLGAQGLAAKAPELQLDPLLELLSEGDDNPLLQAVNPDPARSLLVLTLTPAASDLAEQALMQQADRWQQRARQAGYERLELRDAQGRLRGRQALVGSGMILLAPADSLG